MKYIISLVFLSLLSCQTKNRPEIEITIQEALTNQYPEGHDFEGFIFYDVRIQNKSNSDVIIKAWTLDELDASDMIENHMYGIYKGDTIPLLYYTYHTKAIMKVTPWSFEVSRLELVARSLYDTKYKTKYKTYREFSKDVVANTVLYFITDDKITVVVKNDKALKFKGRPNEQAEYILFNPLEKGKIPHKKKN